MGSYFENIDRFAVRLTRGVLNRRWTVLLAAVIATVALGSGARLPAQGTEEACEHCEARGLCRRNHWT